MRQSEIGIGAALHRAGNIDHQEDRPGTARAPAAGEPHHIAIGADRSAQAAGEIDRGTAPCPPEPIAAPAGKRCRQIPCETGENIARIRRPERADRQGLGFDRLLARFVDVLADEDFAAARLLLHVHFLVRLPVVGLARLGDTAEEVEIEQGVKPLALLRLRRERRPGGLPHLFQRAGAEKGDRLKKCDGLVRRDSEAMLPQQGRKSHEGA